MSDALVEGTAVVVSGFWATLAQMAPYLLLGFLVAGALSVVVSPAVVERHLGRRGLWPVFLASLFGVPLPLCSCGVIPVAASLRQSGASRAATASFLISTPQTGVDSILATYSLLGPVIAVLRPVAAFVSGIVGGAVVELVEKDDSRPAGAATTCDGACWRHAEGGALVRMARYAFYTLPGDIGRPLLVGLAVAGLIGAAVPESFFAEYLGGGSVGRDLVAMLVMLIIGLPVYVCATASIPVAAALMAKGVSPGAALVFLMTGPATNAATIATVWKTMGRRTTAAYLATVAACAFGAGLVLNRIDPKVPLGSVHEHAMSGDWLGTVFAIVLLAVLAVALAGPRLARRRAAALDGEGAMTTLAIEGMTCSHCAASVRAALLACKGVEEAEVDLGRGVAVVKGEAADPAEMRGRIEGLGYKVKDTCAGR